MPTAAVRPTQPWTMNTDKEEKEEEKKIKRVWIECFAKSFRPVVERRLLHYSRRWYALALDEHIFMRLYARQWHCQKPLPRPASFGWHLTRKHLQELQSYRALFYHNPGVGNIRFNAQQANAKHPTNSTFSLILFTLLLHDFLAISMKIQISLKITNAFGVFASFVSATNNVYTKLLATRNHFALLMFEYKLYEKSITLWTVAKYKKKKMLCHHFQHSSKICGSK